MPIFEDREWRHRRGRFKDCEPDTEDRPQIRPGLQPSITLQTHNRIAGGEYHDGTTANMDA
jgi:hypothetical protein